MAKMTPEQKRTRIKTLEQEITEREKEILELLEPPKMNEGTINFPPGFSLNEKIVEVLTEAGNGGLHKDEIRSNINKKNNITSTDAQIMSALSYLKNTKKKVENVGRGYYKIKVDF